jgi:hypothetical protein
MAAADWRSKVVGLGGDPELQANVNSRRRAEARRTVKW